MEKRINNNIVYDTHANDIFQQNKNGLILEPSEIVQNNFKKELMNNYATTVNIQTL